jgi:adenine-specific DNA-methyltransferase
MTKKPIEQYEHLGKERCNNPPVGLVTPETDTETENKTYSYDPHLDPTLQWAGKTEHTSFEVPTQSLHVHERIDPRTIIKSVRKGILDESRQMSLFDYTEENPPLREAIEFYKHRHNWSNRLIAGDSLLVMNSLLEKEGMAGQVQMIYIDPPYGIKYGSNFQPFVNKRDVKDGKDEDLTQEPEMIKAFRDTWELGIHSYLTYLRDRLLLSRELLTESGSVFVQISDENVHHVRELMDEVFGVENFIGHIVFQKTGGFNPTFISSIVDHLLWYGKNKNETKYHSLYSYLPEPPFNDPNYVWLDLPDGTVRRMTPSERKKEVAIPKESRIFRHGPLLSEGKTQSPQEFEFDGIIYTPGANSHWKTTIDGLKRLKNKGLIIRSGNNLAHKLYWDYFSAKRLGNIWLDTQSGGFNDPKVYVVQTTNKTIQRCLLMTTDPGDLVFDPTCGSGTTAYVSEQWGRRWITCDTSRVATTLAKQRLMTSIFGYYELAHPSEGIGSGLNYKTVSHITLKSIAKNEPPATETLYDQPIMDKSKARVSGPFTVEAVPSPMVKPLSDIESDQPADESISRSGETLRQSEWRDELLNAGIRGKGGQKIDFSRVETLPGTRWLHADGETKEAEPQRIVLSFGPEHAPLEQRQVALAIEEAQKIIPKPKIIVFASFQFDPEAAKDIDETDWPGVTLLKVQMNTDLLTGDLKKKRSSNESFWLIGQPDVNVEKIPDGDDKGKYRVEVMGFDYYNTKTGSIDSGGTEKIAMWMLDTDYDGRSLFPSQVFFPMSGKKDGWSRLAKNLKAEIDEERIEAYRGTKSLPFKLRSNRRIAVKIVDDRGIESLKIVEI